MCGIVGAVAKHNIVLHLLEGLKRLEYRGYDSAGIAVLDHKNHLQRIRSVGKVEELEQRLDNADIEGNIGIAHTRWATHGIPSERNAHPHMSGEDVAIVHNGIIENHDQLREKLQQQGYHFTSETDTEVIVHLLATYLKEDNDLFNAVSSTIKDLIGAYALAVISPENKNRMIVVRSGSPLIIGIRNDEYYIASDVVALLSITRDFIFLKEGDMADINGSQLTIYNAEGEKVERPIQTSTVSMQAVDKAPYAHYMLKEIFEQPAVIAETLEGRIYKGKLLEKSFGHEIETLLNATKQVQIIACGTSYHAGMVARYWLEEMGIPCQIEVASEYRYRKKPIPQDCLLVSISQSGETADTLAVLHAPEAQEYIGSLCICNVAESSLVRDSDAAIMTRAGTEIGVASTKAFTCQLVALRLLTIALAKRRGLSEEDEKVFIDELSALPRQVEVALEMENDIKKMAKSFTSYHNALYLGRGAFYPVAMEGALKLKEISYIHAEAYPAGELKHGPLALVDETMPVICALPDDPLLEKVLSNLQEVRARDGELFLFSDHRININMDRCHNLTLSDIYPSTAPIVYSIPLQLLSYYVALLKGTDIDQPRNLAKSVTVE